MRLTFEVQTIETNIVILNLTGDISFDTVPILRKAIYTLVTHKIRFLIMDMRGIRFIDSTGIGALIAANRFIQKNCGSFHLVVTGSHILRLLNTTQLMKVLNVFSSVEKATDEMLIAQSTNKDSLPDNLDVEQFFQAEEKQPEAEVILNPTSVPLCEGQVVEMERPGCSGNPLFFSEVKKADNKNQIILLTAAEFGDLKLTQGDKFMVYANKEDTAYEFELVVLQAAGNTAVFQYPREIIKIEKRNAVRVPCNIPVRFQICDVLGEPMIFSGVIENMSSTGVSLATDKPVSQTDCMGLTFSLPTTERNITVIGKVVRFQKNNTGRLNLGIRFLLLSEYDQNEIERFIKLGYGKHIAFYNKMKS